jgi:hypothetical protein
VSKKEKARQRGGERARAREREIYMKREREAEREAEIEAEREKEGLYFLYFHGLLVGGGCLEGGMRLLLWGCVFFHAVFFLN